MIKQSKVLKDEVNLFQLLKSIWDQKIKVILITIIFGLVGTGYNYTLPEQINKFKYTLNIKSSANSEFIKFVPIYNFLNTSESDLTGISLTGLKETDGITATSTATPKLINEKILDKFIGELMDFEELILTLKNNEKISKKISELSETEQERILFNYAKLFSISLPKDGNSTNHILSFIWEEDRDVGSKILGKTLNLTIDNLRDQFYDELDNLLNIKINAVINQDKRKIEYLLEQSIIAKELDIADNQVENINLTQSNVSFNINTIDAYYLRGYKAIDAEIFLIKNRKYEFFEYLKEELSKIKQEKTKWVDYNIYLLEISVYDVENKRISLNILIAAGLLAGMLFVVISDALIFHLNRQKKTI